MDSNILQILHKDHIHQIELLDLIEAELVRLDSRSNGANLEMIALALEYCADYPDNCHHPAEDAVYARLLHRAPALKDKLVALNEEHKNLAAMTEALSLTISDVIEGGPAAPAHAAGDRFIRAYRKHMDVEESEIFPAARRHLTEEDWDAVAAEIALTGDPLFDEHVRDAYLTLQRHIVERRREPSC